MWIKNIYKSPKIKVTAGATCAALWKHQLKKMNTGKVEYKKQGRGSGLGFTQKRIKKATLSFFQSIHLFSSIHMLISNSALFKRPPNLKGTYSAGLTFNSTILLSLSYPYDGEGIQQIYKMSYFVGLLGNNLSRTRSYLMRPDLIYWLELNHN